MKTRYLLKKRGSAKGATHPIYIALYEGDQTEIIYTGQRITKAGWSKSNNEPIDQGGDIYKEIERVKKSVATAKLRLEADEKPITPFTVKQSYEALMKEKNETQLHKDKKDKEGLKTISSLAKHWKENNLFQFAKATQAAVSQSIDQFTDYLTKVGLAGLERKDLNEDIINGYSRFLQDVKKLADSTHGKRIKHLRWFLKYLKYDVQGIKIRSGKTKIIALTLDELNKLEAVDVSYDPALQKAKDMYLLGCYTGQRISDIRKFNATNTAAGFINLTTKKSGGKIEVKIPIVKETREILNRYENHSPKINATEVNKHIKTICKKAGLNKLIEIEIKKGGQTISKTVPLYEEIVMHTSGKTFISTVGTEKYKMTPPQIAGVVGKSLKTLLGHYFNLPAEEGRRKMIEADLAIMKVDKTA